MISIVRPKLTDTHWDVAPSFEEVVKRVAGIVQDKVVIGHALENDLSVCLLLARNVPRSLADSFCLRLC